MSAVQQALSVPLSPNYPQEVRRQWERFVSGERIEAKKLRPIVRESWKRCWEAGLDSF
jgi:transcriptional regulator of acetoin/glycerol metabolism